MALIQITIKNWSKFNPRSDRVNYSWFRFQNGFFHDQAVFILDDAQRVTWIFMLCEASKTNSGEFQLRTEYMAMILKRSEAQIFKNIEVLISCGLMTAERRRDDGIEPTNGRPTYERTYGETAKKIEAENPENREPIPASNGQASPDPFLALDCYKTLEPVFQLRRVRTEMQAQWHKDFPDPEWVVAKINALIRWELANPRKKKKDFTRFVNAALSRDWPDRKTSGTPTAVSF